MHCLPSLLRKPNNAIRYREHRSWASEFKLTLEVEAQVGFQGLDKETQTSTALSPDHQELVSFSPAPSFCRCCLLLAYLQIEFKF